MAKLQKGDIYLSKFPFTSHKQFKIRPVVVLTEDKTYQDVVIMAISSVLNRWDPSSVVYILSEDIDFKSTGLKKDSCILVNRIATIRKDRLFHQLGRLPDSHIQKIEIHFLNNHRIGYKEQDNGSFIPYGRQFIAANDIYSVIKTLRSDFITQGPKVPEFEKSVANKVGSKHAVAVNSTTSALHLACKALDLGPSHILWTSPITFVASANCALYCGADVDFVDIDPKTYNMCPQALEEKLRHARQSGILPKIVVPVHMCGQSCDMKAIHALSQEYGFFVIEDASHAIGGQYLGEPTGSCCYSDITVFSFHPVKIITTGEGGMAVTNTHELAEKMAILRNHGITRNPDHMRQKPDGPWYYEQIDLGFNYRMTDIQAALGLSQLSRLDEFVSRRSELAARYDRLLADLQLTVPWQHPYSESAWHLYVIRLDQEKVSLTRRQVFEYLRDKGIGVNVHYIPVHTQPYYRRMGFDWGMFPSAEKYYQEAITLPLFPDMIEEDQDRVVEALTRILPTENSEGH